MKTDTLIVGGGLTGLSLALRLQEAGHDYQLLEARPRFGGRIKSLHVDGHAFDLGPSWVWPGQTRIAQLLSELDLKTFAQWDEGTQLFEQPNGEVALNRGFMSMAGSFRINGGTSALIDALVARLDPDRLHLNAAVTEISQNPCTAKVNADFVTANRIVLAIPPRIAGTMAFSPPLPTEAKSQLLAIPTWMAAHAKFVAVYPTPFWRSTGLSGDASSRRGPMVEIHDTSPNDASLGALFGFVGIPAEARAGAADAVAQAALAQLVNLFGPDGGNPIASRLEDWSQEPFTATNRDMIPPPGHPPYGMPSILNHISDGNLIFSITELANDNGGLIEGALAASKSAAEKILGPSR